MAGHGEMPAEAHHMLALCQAGAGDLPAALNSERTAASLDPAFAMPHLQSGLLSRRHGDARTGRRELELAMHLLHREEEARVSLFGGGFSRHALLSLCRAELNACGSAR
jgi:chemotaxis protein methyltransferase CheR